MSSGQAEASSGSRQPRRSRARSRLLAWSVFLGATHAAPTLRAQERDVSDASATLFREGRQLLNQGRLAEACERFRASLALRPSPGTWLNVGNCLEAEGRLVDALVAFEKSESLAARESDAGKAAAWGAAARREAAALERRVARVTIVVEEMPDGKTLQVTLDGRPVERLGEPFRLEPGRHRVEASAGLERPFVRELELGEGQSETVHVQRLDLAPLTTTEPPSGAAPTLDAASATLPVAPLAPAALGAERADGLSSVVPSRVVPWALVAGGGAFLLGGAVTGWVAAEMTSDLKRDCPNRKCEGDLSARDRAFTTAVVADVLMATGVAGALVGTAWLLTVSGEPDHSLRAACTGQGCLAVMAGRF